ncbi:MAG: hypothetical protein M3Z20_14120 [Chloroflexota bacterium]|nr:hypothetical protein [Chloroflexota bacterium]
MARDDEYAPARLASDTPTPWVEPEPPAIQVHIEASPAAVPAPLPPPQPGAVVHHHYQAQPQPPVTINNHFQPAAPMMLVPPSGPSFIVRALWFIFIGWWLSAAVIVLGYVLFVTVLGIPAAFALFNRIPQALTLRPRTTQLQALYQNGIMVVQAVNIQQRPWYWRALYFLLIGWWFGAIWLSLAWLLCIPIITLPLSIMMFDRTGGIMTLQRH